MQVKQIKKESNTEKKNLNEFKETLLRKRFLEAGKNVFLEADTIPVHSFRCYKYYL